MKKVNLYFLFPLSALLLVTYIFSHQFLVVPPLGKLLNPFIGVIQNGNEEFAEGEVIINNSGVTDSVQIFFDARKVPHLYAKNNEDLYFAQGYVTASLRIWEMDFLARFAAGRMSEIFANNRFFDYDRHQRRLGIVEAAKSSLKLIEADSTTLKILSAYTKGVNSYIRQLDYKRMPVENKILDYEIEPWTNLKSVLIMKNMGKGLAGQEQDMSMSYLMLALGEEDFNALYPDFNDHLVPIIKDSSAISSGRKLLRKPDYITYDFLSHSSIIPRNTANSKMGSNSWAVSGKKTRSGHPILCNDPHLGLLLPSIWVEMQLSSPDVNVYGVSIPGTPSIIIGFNEKIAWGLTNGAEDVRDWYKLNVNGNYKQYEMDGKWRELQYQVEEIKRRGRDSYFDTVYYSIHGPIVVTTNFNTQETELTNFAMRWELLNPSNEFLTFIKLNRAANYSQFKDAIKHYFCPSQNFTYAGKDGDIGINHQGRLPVKSNGQGKFILDGTKSSSLYKRYIPDDSLPQVLNPKSEFVQSANQHPTEAQYPYYYNGYFLETRSKRIYDLLKNGNQFDVSEMMKIQLDNVNVFSVEAKGTMLSLLDYRSLSKSQKNLVADLTAWGGNYDSTNYQARLFELWWSETGKSTWDEFKNFSFDIVYPEDYVLLDMIKKEPTNKYFDKMGTLERETAKDIIADSFLKASVRFDSLRKISKGKWGNFNAIFINHLAGMNAFSFAGVPSSGHWGAINAISPHSGPTWRMVVELGERPKGYGIFLGGQSGNVASRFYDNFIPDWQSGKYYPLEFYMGIGEAKRSKDKWIIKY